MGENEAEPARFSDRFVAYSCDLLLFVAGYYASFFLMAIGLRRIGDSRFALLWGLLWIGLWLLYHACFAAEGRQTLGKRLMGIQVYGADGNSLTFGQSLLRAVCYLPSALVLNLGFLWALWSADRQGWHDRLAGTQVVEVATKGAGARVMSALGAWALAGLFALAWVWVYIGAPKYAQMQLLAGAKMGLQSLAVLEQRHHDKTGAYTSDLDALAQIYGNKEELLKGLPQLLDVSTLRLAGGKDRFSVEANALDERRTPLRLEGPNEK